MASLLELSTDLPLEDSTDYPEIPTAEPAEITERSDDQEEHSVPEDVASDALDKHVEEESISSDSDDTDKHDEEEPSISSDNDDTDVRKRRSASKEDEQNEHQHLDSHDEIDSSLLPVEHRGLDDEEEHEHTGSNSSKSSTSWLLLGTSLIALLGIVQYRHRIA